MLRLAEEAPARLSNFREGLLTPQPGEAPRRKRASSKHSAECRSEVASTRRSLHDAIAGSRGLEDRPERATVMPSGAESPTIALPRRQRRMS